MIGMGVEKFGDGWGKMANLPALMNALVSEMEETPMRLASIVAGEMKEAARWNGLRPNSTATMVLKGTVVPLVESGNMVRSIKVKKMGMFDWYGGIDPKARHPSGHAVSDIAVAQNLGYAIPVTDAIRDLFRANGLQVRDDTRFFLVPARPFLTRTFEQADAEIQKTLRRKENRLLQVMNYGG